MLRIVSGFLSEVIAMADLGRDSYQLIMLCRNHKSIIDISFFFNIVNQEKSLELWLTKCLGFKLILSRSSTAVIENKTDKISERAGI